MPRSEDWMYEFGPTLEGIEDPEIRELILDGSIEICPCCGELSAYAWQDASEDFDDEPFAENPGKVAHISTCGSWEWQCGHCGNHIVEADSPINHPCYTHSED